MIKLFIKDDAFHPVRASEGNLLACLHFYEANLNIICRRIDPVLGDFVYVSTFFGKWTCSAKKKSICISIKCITLFRMKGVHIMERFFKYNCKSETTCNPSNYITLKEGWLSVGSFKVVFEEGRRLDSEHEAQIASDYLKFAPWRDRTNFKKLIYLFCDLIQILNF